jgi:cell wall-associated NlpC family hydrolase
MSQLDPKRYPYRLDLAADSLKHLVRASRYAVGDIRQIKVPIAAVRRTPAADAPLDTEALFGERVTVYEDLRGWSWVQLRTDGYVGYIQSENLRPIPQDTSHRVSALRALVFKEADIKSPPIRALSFGSLISCTGAGRFVKLDDGGFVHLRQITTSGELATDFVSVAERFVGSPYLWGGRSSLGLDCSGLVQLAMQAAGHFCPRDSYMQAAEVGVAFDVERTDQLRRGDLVFWKGHVGIMRGAEHLVHANAHHMEVVIEPLAVAMVRMAAVGSTIQAIRRPSALSV